MLTFQQSSLGFEWNLSIQTAMKLFQRVAAMMYCQIKSHCLYVMTTKHSVGFAVAPEEFGIETKTDRE